jgi:hypothetical protein
MAKDKPSHAYYAFCRHADHNKGKCKSKSMAGTMRPDGAVDFKKSSSTGKKAKP